jgi:hypothetical protein
MNRRQVLAEMETARGELLKAIEGLGPEGMLAPGAVGDWSVRDVLQHISLWEAELVKLLVHLPKGRIPPGERYAGKVDIDKLNAKWHAETKDRPLEHVLADFHAVRKQTVRRLETLTDADLDIAKTLPWLRGRPLWEWVADDTWEHDREHAEQIRAWREARGSEGDQ